ncbi:MAG TPA: FAD-binding oxidoreductase [Candidatus Binataceae bacterium]|nr:FAD-binding oxidoreductase [Candidatus Binataceae bacterium]
MRTTEILIIGGGVIGSSIAYHLARAGREVTLIERADIAVEPSASWASAGGVRRQGRHRAEVALALESSARWPMLTDELDAELGYRRGGNLMLAESEEYATRLARFVERQHRNGLADVVLIDQHQVRELAPGVTPEAIAGSFSPADGFADPVLTTRAFASAAQRHGVRYWTSTKCESLIVEDGRVVGAIISRDRIEAEVTILAAGAWSPALAAGVGLDLSLRIEPLQMIRSTPASSNALKPVLSSLGRKLSLKQLPSGSFLLGGGWLGDLMDDDSHRLRDESLTGNWDAACAVLPRVGEQRVDRAWCGLEATTIDDLPLVGPAPNLKSLYLAVGFSGHGFAIAPAIGRAMGDLIAGKPVPELDGLLPRRFADLSAR